MNPQVEKILKLPVKQKIALLLLLSIAIGGAFTWFLILPKYKQYEKLKVKRAEQVKKLEESRRIANNLPQFKKEFDQLTRDLDKALTELPNQKEIPTLLTSITGSGKTAGLDFLVFRPKSEEPMDFYAAVPVDISVSGSYYQVANFFAAVGNLPRIVNISNLSFSNIANAAGRTSMRVNCLATTFRFLDKSEIKQPDKKDKKKKR